MSENKKFKLSEYDETIRFVLENDGEFRLYPRGTSMLPLILQGRDSVVLVKPAGTLRKNDIAFYLRDDKSYVLHRIIKEKDGIYTLCGDNQTTLENGITDRHIIGVVSKIHRKDKLITKNCKGYRLYLFMWQFFVIRRVYFKLRNLRNKFKKKK